MEALSCEKRWLGGESRFANAGRQQISQMQGYCSANPSTLEPGKLDETSIK